MKVHSNIFLRFCKCVDEYLAIFEGIILLILYINNNIQNLYILIVRTILAILKMCLCRKYFYSELRTLEIRTFKNILEIKFLTKYFYYLQNSKVSNKSL